MLADTPKLEPLASGLGYRVCYGKARNRFRIPTTDETLAASRALVELGATLPFGSTRTRRTIPARVP